MINDVVVYMINTMINFNNITIHIYKHLYIYTTDMYISGFPHGHSAALTWSKRSLLQVSGPSSLSSAAGGKPTGF